MIKGRPLSVTERTKFFGTSRWAKNILQTCTARKIESLCNQSDHCNQIPTTYVEAPLTLPPSICGIAPVYSWHRNNQGPVPVSDNMMTSSNGNLFRVTGHLCGEFTGPRWIPRTKASDAELWCFFYLRLNKRLSKQSWGWWFQTLSRPLWRHRNKDVFLCDPLKSQSREIGSLNHRIALKLTETSAALLLRCRSNFRAVVQFWIQNLWLRDFTRSYERTSYWILKGALQSDCVVTRHEPHHAICILHYSRWIKTENSLIKVTPDYQYLVMHCFITHVAHCIQCDISHKSQNVEKEDLAIMELHNHCFQTLNTMLPRSYITHEIMGRDIEINNSQCTPW